MQLTQSQVRYLRQQSHSLKPVLQSGANGISEAFIEEVKTALEAHELIKIKVRAEEREERDEMIAQICAATASARVQRVGHTLTLFKPSEKKKISLPK